MAVQSTDSALHILGVNLEANDVSALHDDGLAVDTRNGRAIYAKAALTSPIGRLALVAPASAVADSSVVATLVSTGNVTSAPGVFAVNQASIAAGQYGWWYTESRIGGRVAVLDACVPTLILYTTGSAGVLDDTTISTGRIQGVKTLVTAVSGSAARAVFSNIVAAKDQIA